MQANGAVALHGSYLRRRGAALAAQFYRVESSRVGESRGDETSGERRTFTCIELVP